MNIAVIAADGRSGRAFVSAALQAGHHVRAGVLNPAYAESHPNLTVVHCDATNQDELRQLLGGSQAIVSLIGHVPGSAADVQTKAIRNVVQIAQKLGIRRIVSLTGTGVRFPGDHIGFVDRVLNLAVRTVDPARINDGRQHVEVLKESGLDWTVIRVLKLQNVPAKPFTLRASGPTKWYVGREEVAQAILQVLEQQSFMRQAPIIGRP
jgi:putative NADH-flavin reductase